MQLLSLLAQLNERKRQPSNVSAAPTASNGSSAASAHVSSRFLLRLAKFAKRNESTAIAPPSSSSAAVSTVRAKPATTLASFLTQARKVRAKAEASDEKAKQRLEDSRWGKVKLTPAEKEQQNQARKQRMASLQKSMDILLARFVERRRMREAAASSGSAKPAAASTRVKAPSPAAVAKKATQIVQAAAAPALRADSATKARVARPPASSSSSSSSSVKPAGTSANPIVLDAPSLQDLTALSAALSSPSFASASSSSSAASAAASTPRLARRSEFTGMRLDLLSPAAAKQEQKQQAVSFVLSSADGADSADADLQASHRMDSLVQDLLSGTVALTPSEAEKQHEEAKRKASS